jgi:hypothetical protein
VAAMMMLIASSAPTGLRALIHITGGRMKVIGLREMAGKYRQAGEWVQAGGAGE